MINTKYCSTCMEVPKHVETDGSLIFCGICGDLLNKEDFDYDEDCDEGDCDEDF